MSGDSCHDPQACDGSLTIVLVLRSTTLVLIQVSDDGLLDDPRPQPGISLSSLSSDLCIKMQKFKAKKLARTECHRHVVPPVLGPNIHLPRLASPSRYRHDKWALEIASVISDAQTQLTMPDGPSTEESRLSSARDQMPHHSGRAFTTGHSPWPFA